MTVPHYNQDGHGFIKYSEPSYSRSSTQKKRRRGRIKQ